MDGMVFLFAIMAFLALWLIYTTLLIHWLGYKEMTVTMGAFLSIASVALILFSMKVNTPIQEANVYEVSKIEFVLNEDKVEMMQGEEELDLIVEKGILEVISGVEEDLTENPFQILKDLMSIEEGS